jgi:hypothetical protein
MLLVIIEDLLHAFHTGVVIPFPSLLLFVRLIPVKDTADEGGYEGHTCLRACDGLGEPEEEGEVAVDLVIALELACGLDAFPSGGDFDQDAVFWDANRGVEGNEFFGLAFRFR